MALRAALLSASSTLVLLTGATVAHAQTAGGAPAGADEVQEVVVTGSRIARPDYSAESPIVSVSQEAIRAAGPASLENALNNMPQFTASAGGTATSATRGGRANANLRGLGIQRTLVLLDGRRMQPSDPLGAIDLNTISTALLENVEVITGGASAVYGSDAIAGVVNFKLKKNFDGLAIDAQYGETSRNDGKTTDISITGGVNSPDGRGNAVLSLSYFNRGTSLRNTREFFRNSSPSGVLIGGLIIPDAANLPTQASINSVFAQYGINGSVIPRSARFGANLDNTLFTAQTPILNLRYPPNEPYIITAGQVARPSGEQFPLIQPLERYTAFGRVRYEVTDQVEAYAEFNYAQYDSAQTVPGRPQATTYDVYVPPTNPFLPADIRAIAASRPNPSAPLLLYFNTGRLAPTQNFQTYGVGQLIAGFDGKVPNTDWTWDAYASYGRTQYDETRTGYISRAGYLSLINAPDGGVSICQGGFAPLGLTPVSKSCQDYLLRTLQEKTILEQRVVEATLQGSIMDLPAGRLRFAVGASYRSNEFEYQPAAERVFNEVLAAGITTATAGSTDVREIFGELLIPVVSDLPFVKSLSFDVAGRYSKYDTIGGVATYKASADWQITDSLGFRGGYQRAIRAPSIGELFAPKEQYSGNVGRVSAGEGDPCDITSTYRTGPDGAKVRALCIASGVSPLVVDSYRFTGSSIAAIGSGNPDLNEETADTFTAGLVWRSHADNPWFARLSASVDYYKISLKDAIGQITANVIMQRCFNGDGNSNPNYEQSNYYCQLYTRNAAGGLAIAQTPSLNLAGYKTSGVDGQLDWSMNLEDMGLGDHGSLSVNFIVSWLDKYEIQNLAGAPFLDYAGTIGNGQIDPQAISNPEWRTATSLTYSYGPAKFNFRWRWVDAMQNSNNVGVANPTGLGVKAVSYFDLSGSYEVRKGVEVRGGILNIGDRQPPEWTGEGATDPALYDMLGRRFYAGVHLKF